MSPVSLCTQSYTDIIIIISYHKDTHTHIHTHTHTHTHSYTHSYTYIPHTHTHTSYLPLLYTHTRTSYIFLLHTHIISLSYSCTHIRSRSPTHTQLQHCPGVCV